MKLRIGSLTYFEQITTAYRANVNGRRSTHTPIFQRYPTNFIDVEGSVRDPILYEVNRSIGHVVFRDLWDVPV